MMPFRHYSMSENNALFSAIWDDTFNEFKGLICHDNCNSKTGDGCSPLYWICWFGRRDMYDYVMSTFGNNGLLLNEQDKYGDTPLILACYKGRKDIAQDLILRGADINIKNKEGKTAFDMLETEEMKQMYTAAVEGLY